MAKTKDHTSEPLVLKNGKEVSLRPILPSDSERILDLFGRISQGSLYQRFLGVLDDLPEDMLHRFTNVNCETDYALVAVTEEQGRDVIIAVARYAYDQGEDTTDLGLTVRDDWQHLGLGTEMLRRLVAIGRNRGVTRFTSMMDPGNTIMEHILRDLGLEVVYTMRSGFFQVNIFIS